MNERTLYLIRHARAAERGPDFPDDRLRPLTPKGHAQAAALAHALSRLKWRFDRLFSSPYTRAWQTAEALQLRGKGRIDPLEALCADDYAELLARLEAALAPGDKRVALVGHEPFLGEVASLMLTGDPRTARVGFKKGGLLVLSGELSGGGMRLGSLLTPAVYRRLR